MTGYVSMGATAAVLLFLGACGSSNECTTEPQSKWLPEAKMREMAVQLGYKVDVLKVSGTCYEIYGRTKDGKKAEVYFNPVTGAPVRTEIG
jgi:hypothetical protein